MDQRINALDSFRFLLIVLMILHHVCYYNNFFLYPVSVLTLPVFPLFMLLSGFLMEKRGFSASRIGQVFLIGLLTQFFKYQAGFTNYAVNILLVWSISVCFVYAVSYLVGSWYFVIFAALVVLPDPTIFYVEYGIAKTCFLLAMGLNFGSVIFKGFDKKQPQINLWSRLGKYPLLAYSGHFAILAVLNNY